MAQHCVSCGSTASLQHCSCLQAQLYCDWCFSLHSRGRPEHTGTALESGIRLCSSCRQRQSVWLCVCDYPWRELCALCSPLHGGQGCEPHSVEPLQARSLLKVPQDYAAYSQRQRLVKDYEARIYANIGQLNACKADLDRAYERLKGKLEDWYLTCKEQLQAASQRVTKAMDEALRQLQARRFAPFLRPTNRLDLLLLRPDPAALERDFTFVRLMPCASRLGTMCVEEHYELLGEADFMPLQDLTLN